MQVEMGHLFPPMIWCQFLLSRWRKILSHAARVNVNWCDSLGDQFDFHSLCLLFWYPLSIFSNGLFVFMVLIYRSASYIPDSILCQLFIQMSVVIWKTLFHLVKFINLILYVSCPLFTVFKETTTSLYQDHKGSLINFLSKVLLFWYLFLSDLMFVYRLK